MVFIRCTTRCTQHTISFTRCTQRTIYIHQIHSTHDTFTRCTQHTIYSPDALSTQYVHQMHSAHNMFTRTLSSQYSFTRCTQNIYYISEAPSTRYGEPSSNIAQYMSQMLPPHNTLTCVENRHHIVFTRCTQHAIYSPDALSTQYIHQMHSTHNIFTRHTQHAIYSSDALCTPYIHHSCTPHTMYPPHALNKPIYSPDALSTQHIQSVAVSVMGSPCGVFSLCRQKRARPVCAVAASLSDVLIITCSTISVPIWFGTCKCKR
jgi:hypothetical protein